jgi:hypothetical protein
MKRVARGPEKPARHELRLAWTRQNNYRPLLCAKRAGPLTGIFELLTIFTAALPLAPARASFFEERHEVRPRGRALSLCRAEVTSKARIESKKSEARKKERSGAINRSGLGQLHHRHGFVRNICPRRQNRWQSAPSVSPPSLSSHPLIISICRNLALVLSVFIFIIYVPPLPGILSPHLCTSFPTFPRLLMNSTHHTHVFVFKTSLFVCRYDHAGRRGVWTTCAAMGR